MQVVPANRLGKRLALLLLAVLACYRQDQKILEI